MNVLLVELDEGSLGLGDTLLHNDESVGKEGTSGRLQTLIRFLKCMHVSMCHGMCDESCDVVATVSD